MSQVHSARRSAFTLIELLVVIAIIAILAAILFPVFAQAKEAAKKAVCGSNMKQIGLSVFMYQNDFDDVYPNSNQERPKGTNPYVTWTYNLQPYIKNVDVFYDPSDPSPVTPNLANTKPSANNTICNQWSTVQAITNPNTLAGNPYQCDLQVPRLSYINNYGAMPAHDWLPVSSTVVGSPANMIVVTERANLLLKFGEAKEQYKGFTGFYPGQPCTGSAGLNPALASNLTATYVSNSTAFGFTGPKGYYTYLNEAFSVAQATPTAGHYPDDGAEIGRVDWARHSGGSNYAFADGHAKYQKLGATMNPNNYEYGEYFYPTPAPNIYPADGHTWNNSCY